MSQRRATRRAVPKRLMLVVLAAAAALTPTPGAFVERFYSTRMYPALQGTITGWSNRAPFALFDVLIVVVLGAWLALAWHDVVHRKGALASGLARIAARTIVWAAGLYLMFLAVWGLNYRRLPLTEKLQFDARAVTADAARSLARTTVDQLNGVYAAAHEAGWPAAGEIDPGLAGALARADRDVGGSGAVVPGRPKPTLLDWYFRRTATDGMTDPYFLETLVSTTPLPFERPFILAHEWSHLAGVADEGDANFVAWLACVRASPASQYSGWLFLYAEVTAALPAEARADLSARLEPGPRADLLAISGRIIREVSPHLAAAGRRFYDQYLKANRVESGVESYGHVVQLVLGARFDPGWIPRPR